MGIGRHFAQACQLAVAVFFAAFGMGVAIGAGMEFDHLRADPVRRLDLPIDRQR